jgi:hypothetical protein
MREWRYSECAADHRLGDRAQRPALPRNGHMSQNKAKLPSVPFAEAMVGSTFE